MCEYAEWGACKDIPKKLRELYPYEEQETLDRYWEYIQSSDGCFFEEGGCLLDWKIMNGYKVKTLGDFKNGFNQKLSQDETLDKNFCFRD